MKSKSRGKILIILIVFLLLGMNFIGINTGSENRTPRLNKQPYNSFKEYIWGGIGKEENSRFGWNLTYIENLNNDAYTDLVVGVPWEDSGTENDVGAVYVFYGSAESGFDSINISDADVSIRGEGLGNRFGWDVADAGDVNSDGINDLIVGAPGILNGRGRAYIFYGGNLPSQANYADRILDGAKFGIPINGHFGSAVSGAGDVNNDGYDDVLVGAPGVSQVIITYGYKEIITIYPNLWDDDFATDPNLVTFRKGCNNTIDDLNTWGINGNDDGWDWIDNRADPSGLYGGSNFIDGADVYGPPESDNSTDGDGPTWSNRTALEVCIGRTHTSNNNYGGGGWNNPGGSAAWGIEFNITTEMYDIITLNGTIKVSFDYQIMDTELVFGTDGTEEAGAVLSRFWNSQGPHFLGDVGDRYVFYYSQNNGPAWGPVEDSFEWDVTDLVDQAGSYYWDFGCYLGNGRFGANEGVMGFFDNISMVIKNDKSTILQGALNSGFGSALTNFGDLNNDGYDDFIVGAPDLDGGHVAIIYGKQFKMRETVGNAYIFLVGRNEGDRFGHSISLAGDVDDDNILDVIIGAPGGDYANLYYGATLKDGLFVPNLWEKTEERDTPKVEFDAGIDSTGNTPGVGGSDDGWDVWDGAYGSGGSGAPGSSTRYNGAESIDPPRIAIDNELIIGVGDDFGDTAKPDSGAYGIEFNINSNMLKAINEGGEVVVSYDWFLDDTGLDNGEDATIKTFIRKAEQDCDLGWDLKTGGTKEVFHMADPEDATDFFVQGCSQYFNRTGEYYVDFGVRVEPWQSQWGGENAIVHFDNFGFYITPPPDKKFIGTPNSGFGHAVGYVDKLNIDNYGDIIIGAPYFDSANGKSSGALYGFFTDMNSPRLVYAQNAEYVHYGETDGDKFGWSISGISSLNSDQFAEIVVGAIDYDYANMNIGRIYILEVTNVPRIRLIHPIGGEILNGTVMVNATVTDPDENVDTELGVEFTYSTDLINWKTLGVDNTPNIADGTYETTWDTSSLPDGSTYYVRGWVQDLELNKGVNISAPITVDNPHEPSINIQNPQDSSIIEGIIDIKALIKDSALDLIGGGIDKTLGVSFYMSDDDQTWNLLGVSNKDLKNEKDVYSQSLDTSIYPDGTYWLRVNATDLDGYKISSKIEIKIDNPWREPSLVLIPPNKISYEELKGTVKISAASFDFDGDINSSGVTFYLSPDSQPYKWQEIGNSNIYTINVSGNHIYSITWDTSKAADGWYNFRAFVNDSMGKTNESIGLPFSIHNTLNNPPQIILTTPKGGDILEVTQPITARVRDLEGNDDIDPNGVFYYYSRDKISWTYLGTIREASTIRVESYLDYDYFWSTDILEDGEYYINISVTDIAGLTSWDMTDEPVIIHHTNQNPPIIRILTPTKGQYISGTYPAQAYAYDLENNIDNRGVSFSVSSNQDDWINIDSVSKPKTGTRTFELSWDTSMVDDGKYWLKGNVKDTGGLENFAISDYFFIHNSENNPPIVTYLWPQSGEVNGTIKINASVFDLENNLDTSGVIFEYSTNQKTWTKIGNDPTGRPTGDDFIYDFVWDTTQVPDNIYWLRARAVDLTLLESYDTSDDYIIIHNNRNNRPIVNFVAPSKGDPLAQREFIVAEVIDFENDVASVSFYYSKDNLSWELIDTRNKPETGTGNTYRTIWDTTERDNGFYYIKIKATDLTGNIVEVVEGPFEVDQGKGGDKDGDETEAGFSNIMLIIIIIVFVIVIILVIAVLMRRSKKREEKLIEEVAAEAQRSQVLEGEIIGDSPLMGPTGSEQPMFGEPGMGGTVQGQGGSMEALQTYIPPQGELPAPSQEPLPQLPAYEADVETIESYKQQMNAWASDGYNVARLEQLAETDEDMFVKVFSIFSANITRLKNISKKLVSLNSAGYEDKVSSIQQKLYEPDEALIVEKEYKELESKITGGPISTGSPGFTPEEDPQNIDDMLPQLLPGDPAYAQTENPGEPNEPKDPVLESNTPADVELPPEVELPETEMEPEPTGQAQEQAQVQAQVKQEKGKEDNIEN